MLSALPRHIVSRRPPAQSAISIKKQLSSSTKLGVPGLIAAYRESAAEAIAAAEIVELTVDRTVRVDFPYVAMNAIMRVVKEQQPRIEEQTFDNLCTMRLAIRESRAAGLIEKLRKAGGSVRDEAE